MYHTVPTGKGNCLQQTRIYGSSHYFVHTIPNNNLPLCKVIPEFQHQLDRTGVVYIFFEMVNGKPWIYNGRTDKADDRISKKH